MIITYLNNDKREILFHNLFFSAFVRIRFMHRKYHTSIHKKEKNSVAKTKLFIYTINKGISL